MGDSHRFEAGDRLHDRYEIRRELGSGGFAVVYAAFDTVIKREVAIKVLNAKHLGGDDEQSQRVLDRFLREAQVAARIRHASIVEIYDFGVLGEGEHPYIIMELLQGADLGEELLDNGPMEPARLFPLFVDVLDALGEAHAQGVVHKDLKPANLFLSQRGTRRETMKIVDFGIAHVNAPKEERITTTGSVSGTPQYLAPEYIQDQSVTTAMDIYQMGLILVEGLTAEPVVQASNLFQAALMHVDRDFSIPDPLRQGAFGEIVQRATALEPSDRFGDAQAFAEALEALDPATIPILAREGANPESSVSPVAETIPWEQRGDVDGEDIETAPTIEHQPTESGDNEGDAESAAQGDPEATPEADVATIDRVSESALDIAVAAISNRRAQGVVAAVVLFLLGAGSVILFSAGHSEGPRDNEEQSAAAPVEAGVDDDDEIDDVEVSETAAAPGEMVEAPADDEDLEALDEVAQPGSGARLPDAEAGESTAEEERMEEREKPDIGPSEEAAYPEASGEESPEPTPEVADEGGEDEVLENDEPTDDTPSDPEEPEESEPEPFELAP